MFFQKIRKLTVGFILSVFIFSSLLGFIVSAQPSNAQAVVVTGDLPAQARGVWSMIENGWKIAVLNAAQQAVSYFLRKVAYDSAVWLASGGKGQSSFTQTKGFRDYLSTVGSDAAGTAISELGRGFGLDLCKIPDVKIELAFRLGLHYNYAIGSEPTKPDCNLATFQANWGSGAWASKYGNGKSGVDVNKIFNTTLTVADSPLGVAVRTTEKIDRLVANQTNAAMADRVEGGGFKAATKLISGDVKTPSQTIKKEAEANTPSEQNKKSETQIAAAMGAGAYQIIPSTLSLFLNTLSAQMLKNFKENGMLPGGWCPSGYDSPACKKNTSASQAQNFDAGASVSGRSIAEAAFSGFLVAELSASSNYDDSILAELNSCNSRGLYNCRVDNDLMNAIQEARYGQAVTIQEAMDKGWLHPDAKLISPRRDVDNSDPTCFTDPQRYCYSNLAVLRQLRIIPLGLEIAAKNSDLDSPWTLRKVVDGFYKCDYDKNGLVSYNQEKFPFCHLVDPNWVIKLPQTRCDALSFGATPLSSGVPDRTKECLDVKTCVGQDKNGNCASWGNCVREKNVWKFNAVKCDEQYATCRTFSNSNGQSVSYLYRTLDTGDCSQDTAGCTAYSLQQDDTGWKTVAPTKYGNYSTGIYLNKNVSTACSADSVGCSAFTLPTATTTSNPITLKKAPDYLNCYDADADQTNGINWPQTFSDIFKMQPSPKCDDYAKVCIADEVGCANYQSADDSQALAIPGKFTPAVVVNNAVQNWNDQCDSRCTGYAAYREMPSSYSSGTPLTYIIPPSKYNQNQSGTTCTADEVNCSSFTNMAATEAGGERVEYFSDLRVCIKPDVDKQKNFYTYEGSTKGSLLASGYQLQSYTLEKDPITGGPKTVFLTAHDKEVANNSCSEVLYKGFQSDADCRQFIDDKGVIYYAMLSNTVVVSADCTSYRLNSAELAGPNQCFGNGEYKDGACYYNGLPDGITAYTQTSQKCRAEAASCREYKGNNGNNIKPIFANSIETFFNQSDVTTANGWSSTAGTISWSTESTHPNDHSLGFVGVAGNTVQKTLVLKPDTLDLQNNMSYSLSFWAKGSGVNVNVSMSNPQSSAVAGTITANTSWQYFTFNLVELQSAGTSTINFQLNGAGNLFLDNIRLTKVSEFLYLVKDSLKVDPICDDNQTDNLPGVALGCSAYSGPKNSLGDNLYYLTNFSFLCRAGAIGCTAFLDTFNKGNGSASRAYNVSLTGISGTMVTVQVGNDSYSCQIEQGKNSCYKKILGHTKDEIENAVGVNGAKAEFVTSTYFIPGDTDVAAPIYLVANQSVSCNDADLGCTYAGIQKSTPSGNQFQTAIIKLDPSLLEASSDASGNLLPGILCSEKSLGCSIYGSSQGDAYFKDPAVTGAKICKYNPGLTKDGNTVSGWFWKDVGVCGSTSTPTYPTISKNCSDSSDCDASTKFNTCIDINIQPCYPDYLKNSNDYGLWSYGNKDKYKNFVGECSPEQNTCTEFVDHADNNTAYYYLNDKSKISEGDCAGMASQKAGCAIFDQTDNPNKKWNTTSTYLLSDSYVQDQNSDLSKATKVQPIDKGEQNDANVLIKVTRDRECAEWLQCRQSKPVWDSQLSNWKNVCETVDRCNRLPADAKEDNPTNCAQFIGGQHQDSNQKLTENMYTNRDIRWSGHDYDGLSILGMFPVEELEQFNINMNTSILPDWRLAKPVVCGTKSTDNCPAKPLSDYSCIDNNVACGPGKIGLCLNHNCLRDPFGSKEPATIIEKAPIYTCRAYPDFDSPFPNLIPTAKQGFSNVNKCGEYPGDNAPRDQALKCDCNYSKVSFGNGATIKYYSYDSVTSTNPNISICVGGNPIGAKKDVVTNGELCAPEDSNTTTPKSCPGGICQTRDKVTKFLGWQGLCLEYDLSRTVNGQKDEHPCLSWLPVDKLDGAIDINDQNPKAGFQAASNLKYCLNGDLYQKLKSFGKCFGSSYGNNDIGCNNDVCRTGGQAFCAKFPGFRLKTEAEYGTIDPNGDYCGGAPINAASGYDCNGTIDDCRWDCVPSDSYPNIAGWGVYDKPLSSSETTIGCRIGASIVGTDVAWTDNIWKGKKDSQGNEFRLSVADTDFQTNLNYSFSSQFDTFARLGIDTGQDTGQDIIKLMYCKTAPFSMPSSMGICSNAEGGVGQNLTYGSWKVPVVKTCKSANVNGDCNDGIKCAGTNVETNSDLFYCQRFCRTDNDCLILPNFNGVPQALVPGLCVGYESGNQVGEILGKCKNMADKMCIPFSEQVKAYNGTYYTNYYTNCQRVDLTDGTVYKDSSGKCIAGISNGTCTGDGPSKDKGCKIDDDCYNQLCVYSDNGNICISSEPPKPKEGIVEKINKAFNEFQQLFAKINLTDFWFFSISTQNYSLLVDDKSIDTTNITNDVTAIKGKSPTIHSVGPCISSGNDVKCIENSEDNITINDHSDTNVRITAQPHSATIKFFVYADKNQMPIKRIIVNWDDGKTAKTYGGQDGSSFSNQRGAVEANTCTSGKCNYVPPANSSLPLVPSTITCTQNSDCNNQLLDICKPEADATDFGTILKTTCDNHYFVSNSTYNCTGPTDPHWNKEECNQDPKMKEDYPDGCCVFHPKVQVLDNWGWCNRNGNCGDATSPGGVGCYNSPVSNGLECDKNFSSTANTPFMYNVLVAHNKTISP